MFCKLSRGRAIVLRSVGCGESDSENAHIITQSREDAEVKH